MIWQASLKLNVLNKNNNRNWTTLKSRRRCSQWKSIPLSAGMENNSQWNVLENQRHDCVSYKFKVNKVYLKSSSKHTNQYWSATGVLISLHKALDEESAFRLQRCQWESFMCKTTVYVITFNISRKQNFKTPCWAFGNPINFYWFFYQIEIVSVNVQLPLDVTIIIVAVGVYSKFERSGSDAVAFMC